MSIRSLGSISARFFGDELPTFEALTPYSNQPFVARMALMFIVFRLGPRPLARPLTLVTNAPPEGLAADFIDYARSAQVHDLVRKLYFVPLDG